VGRESLGVTGRRQQAGVLMANRIEDPLDPESNYGKTTGEGLKNGVGKIVSRYVFLAASLLRRSTQACSSMWLMELWTMITSNERGGTWSRCKVVTSSVVLPSPRRVASSWNFEVLPELAPSPSGSRHRTLLAPLSAARKLHVPMPPPTSRTRRPRKDMP
jgi:hypothetical protein